MNYIMWSIIVLIFLIIIVSLCFARITVKVIKRAETNVDLIIGRFIGYRLDVDGFMKDLAMKTSPVEVPRMSLQALAFIKDCYPFLESAMSYSHLKKVTVIPKLNVADSAHNSYLAFGHILMLNMIKHFFDNHFKSCADEYYQVSIDYRPRRGFNIELIAEINLWRLIILIMKNYPTLRQILKRDVNINVKEELIENGRTPN